MVRQILSRQIEEITHSTELTDRRKDALVQDVAGALYDAQAKHPAKAGPARRVAGDK